MLRQTRLIWLVTVLLFAGGLTAVVLAEDISYLLVSLVLIVSAMLPFFARFEWRHVHARELVLLAVLAAVAAVSRVPFAALPSVQPTSFVIIVAGMVLGGEAGFFVGAMAALVSNLFLGQGPWTPWQMFAWGMIGFTSGLLGRTPLLRNRWGRLAFGFVWGFLFGWIMNAMYLVSLGGDFTWGALVVYYGASVLFDLAHALSNVFFLAVFGAGWIRLLTRYKLKYGLLGDGRSSQAGSGSKLDR